MIDATALERIAVDYLPRQRWFGASGREIAGVSVHRMRVLRAGFPGLVWALVDAAFADGGPDARFQLVVGLRPVGAIDDFLKGKVEVTLGEVRTSIGMAIAYDAVVDRELALDVLAQVAPDERAKLARVLSVEQSNTSIVYDEAWILKLFRRVQPGANPDVEVVGALADHGFDHVVPNSAVWRDEGSDLAVLRPYLAGGVDGMALALASLRDLYDRRTSPAEAGGDFGPEALRLGATTAELHLALARAFGSTRLGAHQAAESMRVGFRRLEQVVPSPAAIEARYDRVDGATDVGMAIRVHGDYHLGQVLRTDDGWFVLDFEGEPARPVEERIAPTSPLKDVAGMVRSFDYAARMALGERFEGVDAELRAAAKAWRERATDRFLAGYFGRLGASGLLPATVDERTALLGAYELDKAVYELGYEVAHRPGWVDIPAAAIERILAGSS